MKCASFERASEIAASAGYGAVREATYKIFLGFKYDVTPKYQKGKIIAAK